MRPKERRETGQKDLFKARLDQIVDMSHPLAKLAGAIDWGFLETSFGAAYSDKPGHPPLATRMMAGIAILKHMHDLSDEVLCERWVENPYCSKPADDALPKMLAGHPAIPKPSKPSAIRSTSATKNVRNGCPKTSIRPSSTSNGSPMNSPSLPNAGRGNPPNAPR